MDSKITDERGIDYLDDEITTVDAVSRDEWDAAFDVWWLVHGVLFTFEWYYPLGEEW